MSRLIYINVIYIFDQEAMEIQDNLINSAEYLFQAHVEDIQKQSGVSTEQARRIAGENFEVIVIRRDNEIQDSHFEEEQTVQGYQMVTYVIGREDTIVGGKLEALACSLWLIGTRFNVLHDIPFTTETAQTTLRAIKEWEFDTNWCLLLAKPKRKFLFWKDNYHFGVANLAYLKRGLLSTSWDVINQGSEYTLEPVFKIMLQSSKKNGWRERYFERG